MSRIGGMIELKLVFFEGCPRVAAIRGVLLAAGFHFEEINQNNLSDGHPLQNYTSPSILKGNRVIFGTLSGSNGGGCSLEAIPTVARLQKLIGNP